MVCLDTTFLIDVLNAEESASETMAELDEEAGRTAVTPVTATELWIGAHQGSVAEYRETEELLDSLLWLDVSRSCAQRAGSMQTELLEEESRLGFNDCLIAAMAIEHGHEVVTGGADFEAVPELRVRTY